MARAKWSWRDVRVDPSPPGAGVVRIDIWVDRETRDWLQGLAEARGVDLSASTGHLLREMRIDDEAEGA